MTTMRGQSLTLSILVALCLAPGQSQSQDGPAWREDSLPGELPRLSRTRSVASTRRA